MDAFCTTCGRPVSPGKQFCTGCGTRLPPPQPPPQPPRGPRRTAAMVAVAAVLTGAGTGGWLLASHLGNHGASLRLAPAAAEHTTAAVTTAPASSPDGVSPSAALSTTPPQPVPQTVGTVTLSQDVTQDSDAQPVAAFLNQY